MEKIDFLSGFLIALGVAWVSWQSYTTVTNGNKIQELQIKDETRKNDVTAMIKSFDKIELDLKDGFDKINNRFDLFTKREIELLSETLRGENKSDN